MSIRCWLFGHDFGPTHEYLSTKYAKCHTCGVVTEETLNNEAVAEDWFDT